MNKDKLHILNQITNMWYNDLELGYGASSFEGWCEDNIENKKQKMLMNKVKDHVDEITFILENAKGEV